jgi:sulfide dehydrogenase [flavocytochrome c] flavoprotein chain
VGVIGRREFLALLAAALSRSGRAQSARARIVIVGGGFSGGCCALELHALSPQTDVTLIDAQSRYFTCPMSNAALVGLRDLRSLLVTRTGIAAAGIRYVRARVSAIDAGRRRVRLASGESLPYDRLVLAPGIRFRFGTPEGYDPAAVRQMPHAWEAGPQTQLLAAQLHDMPDGGTVAICVPGGLMRCPPGPYERAGLIADWLKAHRRRSKVLIFDANNHFPRQDVFQAAWQALYPGMIEWIPSTEGGTVTRVDPATRTLFTDAGVHHVAVANVIPPQAPGELALSAGLAQGHGWCPVHPETFESQLLPGIHVIGDACIAGAMPKAASAGVSQARQCAAAIAAQLAGQGPPAATLESVCYSMVSAESAFAIRGRFEVTDGELRALESVPPPADAAPSSAHLYEATAWYAQLRQRCFASAG